MDEIFGSDLNLGFQPDEDAVRIAGPFSSPDLQARLRENVAPRADDLSFVSGRANLAQALILRLMTERGELTALGMPDYGSRHHNLIGMPNTDNNRNLLKLYILDCLRQEPRVERIVKITVEAVLHRREEARVEIWLQPRRQSIPLNLVIPFSFDAAGIAPTPGATP